MDFRSIARKIDSLVSACRSIAARCADGSKRAARPSARRSLKRCAEKLATAHCIATDATGVLVQPAPRPDKQSQPCRRAHFFVQIADADHVFFEYTPIETSAVVSQLFAGYAGFVQADAKSVFDILYRPPKERDRVDDDRVDRAACV